jgi:hypothetical protein
MPVYPGALRIADDAESYLWSAPGETPVSEQGLMATSAFVGTDLPKSGTNRLLARKQVPLNRFPSLGIG